MPVRFTEGQAEQSVFSLAALCCRRGGGGELPNGGELHVGMGSVCQASEGHASGREAYLQGVTDDPRSTAGYRSHGLREGEGLGEAVISESH